VAWLAASLGQADAQVGGDPVTATAVKCPTHKTPLDGGPIQFWCNTGGHSVRAADIDHEYHPPVGRAS
jgi:hypothetical protein